jgi:glycosyltransferase involved in cell wall biosynthesis
LDNQEVRTRAISYSYTWAQLGKRLALHIAESKPDVVVGFAIRGAPRAMRRLYGSGGFGGHYLDLIQSDIPSEYVRVRANSDFAAGVGCVSDGCLQKARKEIPELGEHVFRVYYPVPCPSVQPAGVADVGRIKLAYLGMVRHREKRALDLIPLVRELLARKVDFELTIIGDGTERRQLEEGLLAIPGAGERVRFLGMLPNAEALKVLSQQHVLLLVSEVEGQPIAMLEAMALGVIPVVSDLAGMREILVPGQTGFLAPVGSTADFASHIEYLARNPGVRSEMGVAAWRKISHDHEMKTAVGRFAELLETVRHLPLPDLKSLAPEKYPDGTMNRYRVPHSIQALKRRLMRQIVF